MIVIASIFIRCAADVIIIDGCAELPVQALESVSTVEHGGVV